MMRVSAMVLLKATLVAAELSGMRADDRCPVYGLGTVPAHSDMGANLRGARREDHVLTREQYHRKLKNLNVTDLYNSIVRLMTHSQDCWPADGPQDGDLPSYAGLFERTAWHCSGTFRLIDGQHAAGGCEGARQRHWPENEWRDNVNLDKARSLLGQVKDEFKDQVSWADLITFAGTVSIKASGGPAKKFCFGRVDETTGQRSVPLGVEGTNSCNPGECRTDAPCENHFRWPEQDDADHFLCNLTQTNFRLQASHSVGLIYVFPEGPQLKSTQQEKWVHNRSPRLSALEVRDTFKGRMGWTDRETVALIGGGHTPYTGEDPRQLQLDRHQVGGPAV